MPLFSSLRRRNVAPTSPVDEPVRSATPPGRSRGVPTDDADAASSTSRSSRRPHNHDDPLGTGVTRNNESQPRGRLRSIFRRRHRSSSSDRRIRADLARDPGIMTVRGKIADAVTAEARADEALDASRVAVREAKDHVKSLEKEALEEYVFFLSNHGHLPI
jgi:hypothetical protein